jgi:hypothetical protein
MPTQLVMLRMAAATTHGMGKPTLTQKLKATQDRTEEWIAATGHSARHHHGEPATMLALLQQIQERQESIRTARDRLLLPRQTAGEARLTKRAMPTQLDEDMDV